MATRQVYAYYYPEVEAVVDELWASRPHQWYRTAWDKHQDTMHEPFINGWREWSGIDVSAFPYGYPTNGASEVIKDLMLPPGKLHVFDGEYEGYAAIAKARRMKSVSHPRSVDVARQKFGRFDQFWISNPSAIDGNAWPQLDEFLDELQRHNPHVRVHLDVTYVGGTAKRIRMDPSRHPNVAAVVFSLSKPMGVYFHRIGGVYSREAIGTLWGNFWFKNIFSVKLGQKLIETFARCELPQKYEPVRTRALETVIRQGIAPPSARPSDVVLLANAGIGADEYRRAEGAYRFCLSPHMHAIVENGWMKVEK